MLLKSDYQDKSIFLLVVENWVAVFTQLLIYGLLKDGHGINTNQKQF
jgi:hypothetical protein